MNLHFDPAGGLIIVPARLQGPAGDSIVRMAIDTGATVSVLSWDVAMQLGYDPAIESDRAEMTTASGVEYCPRIRIAEAEALGVKRLDLAVVCHTLPPQTTVVGLLGLNFFSDCRLVIDFRDFTVSVDESPDRHDSR